jgi:K+-sensing histidine kinase KdpD
MMERLFFHDIMNVAGAIQGLTDILIEMAPNTDKAQANLLEVISENAKDLIELLKSQKDLLSAENNELSVYSKEIRANQLIHAVKRFFERNEQYKNRHIEIQTCQDDSLFSCDERLLKRVIVNAVKNALEAVSEGETVQIRYKAERSSVVFEIHNHSFIPEDVQSQIFRKSFSTKGTDRGIGTYSIKLFTEKYLKGKAWFISQKNQGTTFYIQIPTGL